MDDKSKINNAARVKLFLGITFNPIACNRCSEEVVASLEPEYNIEHVR